MRIINRVHLAIAAFIFLAGILCVRVAYLHIIDKDFLQDQGDARTHRVEITSAHRGMIQDRRGKLLAISTPQISLWANPQRLLASEFNLPKLAQLLRVDAAKLSKKLLANQRRSFIYLRRHMQPAAAKKILDLHIKGIYGKREYKRFYPAGEAAAHLVGFTNIDDKGQEGIELSFDAELKGKPGKKKVLKNLFGEIVGDIMPMVVAEPGKDMTLSIDLRLQYLAYQQLKSVIAYYQAKSGSVVILDVKTGEILSLVNQPSYNPGKKRAGLNLASVRNRAVTDVFEPGSTVKPFVVAVALESGRYKPGSTIDTSPGYIRIGRKTIPDPRNYGVLDLGGVIAKSSQVGITKLALSLDENDVYNQFSALGFGQKTGIKFPGESAGYLPNHRRWKDIERATFAYGYGFQVTSLQLAAAYQVIASSGMRRDLTLLHGQIGEETRVFSEQTAGQLIKMLQRAVSEGTGFKAAIEGYSVAGKTGTARILGASGAYVDTRHIAFFAGITPAENPSLVGVVIINDPVGNQYGGGGIAAPVFSSIMTEALRLLGIPPDIKSSEKYARAV